MILFSILIATLESREEQFNKLHTELMKQIEENNLQDEVEILVFQDNFDYPVGMKRNTLLADASGLFAAFVDDDDLVSDDYVISIIQAIKENPEIDCVGIKGILISPHLPRKEFIHSIKYKEFKEDRNYYYRPPNHLNPIRVELSRNFLFPVINNGEDFDWTMKICKANILKKEAYIDKVLYKYMFSWDTTEAQRGRTYD